jgi:2'-5' RNA ligase
MENNLVKKQLKYKENDLGIKKVSEHFESDSIRKEYIPMAKKSSPAKDIDVGEGEEVDRDIEISTLADSREKIKNAPWGLLEYIKRILTRPSDSPVYRLPMERKKRMLYEVQREDFRRQIEGGIEKGTREPFKSEEEKQQYLDKITEDAMVGIEIRMGENKSGSNSGGIWIVGEWKELRAMDDDPNEIRVYRGVSQNSGKSGFYPGIHYTTMKSRAEEFGDVGQYYIKGPFKDLSDNAIEKVMVDETGHSGSGYYLAKKLWEQGYKGIQRGNEYIVFDETIMGGEDGVDSIEKKTISSIRSERWGRRGNRKDKISAVMVGRVGSRGRNKIGEVKEVKEVNDINKLIEESKKIEQIAKDRFDEYWKKNPTMEQTGGNNTEIAFLNSNEISRLQDLHSQINVLENRSRGIETMQDLKDIVQIKRKLRRLNIDFPTNGSKQQLTDMYEQAMGKEGKEHLTAEQVGMLVRRGGIIIKAEYDHSSIQTSDIPKELKQWIKKVQSNIPKEDLSDAESNEMEGGFPPSPHVTLAYGTDSATISDIQSVVDNRQLIANIANVDYFTHSKEYDVAVLKLESPALQELHNDLNKEFGGKDEYNEYTPHITIAYLKKGGVLGPEIVSKDIPKKEWQIKEIELSKKDTTIEKFRLKSATLRLKSATHRIGKESGIRGRLKEASIFGAYWIDPAGKIYNVGVEESTGEHEFWIDRNINMLKREYGITIPEYNNKIEALILLGWTRVRMENNNLLGIEVENVDTLRKWFDIIINFHPRKIIVETFAQSEDGFYSIEEFIEKYGEYKGLKRKANISKDLNDITLWDLIRDQPGGEADEFYSSYPEEAIQSFETSKKRFIDFPDPFPVFRALAVKDVEAFVKSIREELLMEDWPSLGVYWTWDLAQANVYEDAKGESNEGWPEIVVCGEVSKKDVDWIETLQKNTGDADMAYPESEIKVFPGSKIKLTEIRDNENNEDYMVEGGVSVAAFRLTVEAGMRKINSRRRKEIDDEGNDMEHRDISDFLYDLTVEDIGRQEFGYRGRYLLRFEGFTDACWADADERGKSISDLETEIMEGWNAEEKPNGYEVQSSGWYNDDMFYAIYKRMFEK